LSGKHPRRDTPDPSVAIDLSRRKRRTPPTSAVAAAADEVVRESLIEARRAAAPYVTMTRIALAQLAGSRLVRLGGLLLAAVVVVAALADMLASNLPVVCRWRGTVYVLPNVTHPAALAALDCTQMSRTRQAQDWMLRPLVAYGPAQTNDAAILSPPLTGGHPFGTDALGRDVFARTVHGARTALGLGLGASGVLVLLGVTLGALAGFAGGAIDTLVTRAVESLTAIPTLVLVLIVSATVPHPTAATLLWTIALTRWTDLARLVRAEVLLALGTDYVVAARALGVSPVRVLWRHVLPNAIGPAIVAAAFGVASVVLIEAAVDFLRVGPPSASASWGEMLAEARGHADAWWLVVFPGTALLATLISLNLVGEAARDALDPKLRGAGEKLTEAMRS
jgi:peptide/nickel transport system permease protein